MAILILGLLLFLGIHSIRIVADDRRSATIGRIGEKPWKGVYALLSITGFVLIVWGFALARREPVLLWQPPTAMRHIAGVLMLAAFILLVAPYVPRNSIKARLHHPMALAVKTWAVAHLLANGGLADVVLFGAFLVWAAFSFRAARQRDRQAETVYPAGTAGGTTITVLMGVALWAGFAFWAHGFLFGVRPFG